MTTICNVVPMVGDNNLPSRVFQNVIQLSRVLDAQTLDMINNQFGSIRDFATYIFGKLQTTDSLQNLDVYYEETSEPHLKDVIRLLSQEEESSEVFNRINDFYNVVLDNSYNPIILFNSDFTETDISYSNLVLGQLYLQIISEDILSVDERVTLKSGESGLRQVIIKYLGERITKSRNNNVVDEYKDNFVKSYLTDIVKPNSIIWTNFLSYLNRTYGVNYINAEFNPLANDIENEFEFDSEGIDVVYDAVQADRIDRKNTISSLIKTQIALKLNDVQNVNSKANKLYIPEPLDINKLWNRLIHLHTNDITEADVIKTLERVSQRIPSFQKIYNLVKGSEELSPTDSNNFRVAYINAVKLAIIPSDIITLNRKGLVSQFTNNRESFAYQVYANKFDNAISTGIDNGLYNIADITARRIKSLRIGKNNNILNEQLIAPNIKFLAEALNFDISLDAIESYFDTFANDTLDVRLQKYEEVITSINRIANDVIRLSNNPDSNERFNENGNIIKLASIASYDFNSITRLSYTDVKGELNYSPQFDSFLTKLFRALNVNGRINEDYVKSVFQAYRNDETLELDNLLWYDEKTGIGIFDRNGNINQTFVSQLRLSQFDGSKINDTGYKYRELQSTLYTFNELIQNLLGEYIFLTSDSPRSYKISVQQIETNDLYNEDGIINIESPMFIALSKILKSQVNEFYKAGQTIFNLPQEEISKYHGVKYHRNGQVLQDGIPTGRQFQFLDITYVVNNQPFTFIDYVAQQLGSTRNDIYKNLVAGLQNGIDTQIQLMPFIDGFISEYISWQRDQIIPQFGDLQRVLLTLYRENQGVKTKLIELTNQDSQLRNRIQEEYNLLLQEKESKGIPITDELRSVIESQATENILNNTQLIESESFKDALLKIVLNNTVYNNAFNNIVYGKLGEYKNTIDYNKRISQIIKNGFNSLPTTRNRKIAVIDDVNLYSNISNELFGTDNVEGSYVNDEIRDALQGTSTINDSMSIMTDVGAEEFLKANGRWNEYKDIFNDIRNNNVPFNPNNPKYKKLVEQLKLFGTSRRSRGEFVPVENVSDYFANQVESVQIKDSTIVLFKNLEAGKQSEQLYDWMILNEFDQVSPISSVKVAGVTPIRIHDDNGNLTLPDEIDGRHIITMFQSDFVIQQDIPADILDETIVFGNQLLKQLLQGLNWNDAIYQLDGRKLTGREIFKEFQDTLSANIKESALRTINDFGGLDEFGNIKLDAQGYIALDESRVVDMMQDIIQDDASNTNIKQILEKDINGLTLFPISYPLIYRKFERILTSRITKDIIRISLPGLHAPLRSDLFNNPQIDLTGRFREQSQEEINQSIDDALNNTTVTYSQSFIDDIKNGNRDFQLQASHTYLDGQLVHYAEVIINPWMSEFYDTIGYTKTLANGKQILTVDIDAINQEDRRMLGIRIPTEGKQSMIIFEVVGFLNSGATQAIFPGSLVKQTGWDFDIDTIYAYYKHLIFDQGRYRSVKFNNNIGSETGQYQSNFYNSIIGRQILEISNQTEDSQGNTVISYATKEPLIYDNAEEVTILENKVVYPLVFDIIQGESFVNAQDFVSRLNDNDNLSNDQVRVFNRINKILNVQIPNIINRIKSRTFNYGSYLSDITLEENVELLRTFVPLSNEDITEIYSRNTNTPNQKLDRYYKRLPIRIANDIRLVRSLLEEVNNQINTISETENIDIILNGFNLDQFLNEGVIYEGLSNPINPFIELDNIEESINNRINQYTERFSKDKSLNRYELNSKAQRDNHILDIASSILGNDFHINETTKPNETTNIIRVSNRDNGLWQSTLGTLNPNNLQDKIFLNNVSMGSRDLKGYSVNTDNIVAILSTLNGYFRTGVKRAIDIRDLPITEDLQIVNNKITNQVALNSLKNILGVNERGNLNYQVRGDKIVFEDKYIGNNASYTNQDISGQLISYQLSERTSAILDVLKSGLMFNLNQQTIGVFGLLTIGPLTEYYYDGTNNTNEINRYSYASAFIQQPIVVDLVRQANLLKITSNTGNDTVLVKRSLDIVRRNYSRELFDLFRNTPNASDLENYGQLNARRNQNNFNLTKENRVGINDIINNPYDLTRTGNTYYSTRELLNFIQNRNNDDTNIRIGYLISQLEILNTFEEYNDLSIKLKTLMFALRTETPVNTFYKADSKEMKLADYYINKEEFTKLLFETANDSSQKLEQEILPLVDREIDKRDIRSRFNLLPTVTSRSREGFLVHNDNTNTWHINGYEDLTINPRNFITKFDAISETNAFGILQTVQQRRNKIQQLGIDYTPVGDILINNNSIIDAVFTGNLNGYIEQTNDGTGQFVNNYETSQYGHIAARYQYGHWFAANGFGKIFAQRTPIVKFFVNKFLIDNNKINDEKSRNYIESHIIEYVAQNQNRSIIKNIDTSELNRVIGNQSEELINRNKDIVKRIKNTLVIDGDINQDSFLDFVKLTLKDKIQVLLTNPLTNRYINSQEFKNNNIFNFIEFDNTFRSRNGYDMIRIIADDNNTIESDNITNSIQAMWDSKIPYIANTIRDLLVYSYLVEGFQYGYKVSKYIPIRLLNEESINEDYLNFITRLGVSDIATDISDYGIGLRNATDELINTPIDTLTSLDENIINDALSYISRQQSIVNPTLPNNYNQRRIFDKTLKIATFGYLPIDDGSTARNSASVSLNFGNNEYNVYIETRERVENSNLANSRYLNSDRFGNLIYKRSNIFNKNGTDVYIYYPVSKLLQNEYSEHSIVDRLNIPNTINQHSILNADSQIELVEIQPTNIEDYIIQYGYVDNFLNDLEYLKRVYNESDTIIETEFVEEYEDINEDNDQDALGDENLESVSPTIEEQSIQRSSPIQGLVNYVGITDNTLTGELDRLSTEANTFIYIGNEQSIKGRIHSKINQTLYLNFNENPITAANRISNQIQQGKIYINGDTVEVSQLPQEYINSWVQQFVDQVYHNNGNIDGLITIADTGVAFAVDHTYISEGVETYALNRNQSLLRSSTIKVSYPELLGIETRNTNNANIALKGYETLRRLNELLNKYGIDNSNEIQRVYRSFKYEVYNENLETDLKAHDFDTVALSLEKLAETNSYIYDVIESILNDLTNRNFETIKLDFAKYQDYKETLSLGLKLTSILDSYENISPYTYQDANIDTENNEELKRFDDQYAKVNEAINKIRGTYSSSRSLKNNLIALTKQIIADYVVEDSRNPQYATAFSKIKEYLLANDFNVDGLDVSNLKISRAEIDNILDTLFDLRNQDINFMQSKLDSAMTTGITALDIVAKQYVKAKQNAVNKVQSIEKRVEDAINQVDPTLNRNRNKLANYFKKFVDENGDLIDDYKRGDVLSAVQSLGESISETVFNLYKSSSTELITDRAVAQVVENVRNQIDRFNTREDATLTRLTNEQYQEYLSTVEDMTVAEIQKYLKLNDLVLLKNIGIGRNPFDAIYRLEYKDSAIDPRYAALNETDRQFLTTIKDLIQEVIFDYDTNYVPYFNTFSNLLPFIRRQTLQDQGRQLTRTPKVQYDQYYYDIDGKRKNVLNTDTLKVPEFNYRFKIEKQIAGELDSDYQKRIVDKFKNWYKNTKNRIAVDINTINTISDIQRYNDETLRLNRAEKYNNMSFDIKDIMRIFTNQLYQTKALKDFQVDFDLNSHLLDQANAPNVIPRALQNYNRFPNIINNSSKNLSSVDVLSATLLRYSSVTFMWGNWTAGIKNIFKGLTDMIIETSANNFVDRQSLNYGLRTMIQLLPKYIYTLKQSTTDNINIGIIKSFDDIFQDTTDAKISLTGSGALVQMLSRADDIGYSPNNLGEYIMQFGMLLACTRSHRVAGGRIIAFNDFFNDTKEQRVLSLLTDQQRKDFYKFRELKDEQIRKYENRKNKRYGWTYDYAGEYLRANWTSFSREQKQQLNKETKNDRKRYKELFNNLPTLESQLELRDGYLTWKKDSGLNQNSITEFKQRVQGINQSLHGIYNRIDRNALQDASVTELFMQFRKWMRPNYVRYFGRKWNQATYNESLGTYEIPIYKPFFDWWSLGKKAYQAELSTEEYERIRYTPQAIGKILFYQAKALGQLKFYYNTLDTNAQASAIKWIKHISTVAFFGAATLLVGLMRDEDDEENSQLYSNILFQLYSTYQEVMEPIPVYGWFATINTIKNKAFVGESVITAGSNLLLQLARSIYTPDEEFIYDRGIYKGQDKRAVNLKKVIPLIRQIEKSRNLQSSMSFYKYYNPFV